MEFWEIHPKICGNFQFKKNFITQKIDEKADILLCERIETIIHFRKNMMAQSSFCY